MRWFKHMTASANDEKLSRLMDVAGLEGYGFWWRVVEIVGEGMDENGKTTVTLSVRRWCNLIGIRPQTLAKLMRNADEIGLFCASFAEVSHKERKRSEDVLLTVNIPNILKYNDEWTRKKRRNSGVAPESLRSKEENRREENKNYPLPSCEEGRCAGEKKTPRETGTNPKALGTNPRALGANPRSLGTNPRAVAAMPEPPGIGAADEPARAPGAASHAHDEPAPANPAVMDLGFHEFLNAYPAAHREPVGEAALVWKKLARERTLPGLPRLLQGLDAWEDSDQWRKDGGAYIPKAANFLRRSMWLSAPPSAVPDDDWEQARREGEARRARLRAAARGTAVPGAQTGAAGATTREATA